MIEAVEKTAIGSAQIKGEPNWNHSTVKGKAPQGQNLTGLSLTLLCAGASKPATDSPLTPVYNAIVSMADDDVLIRQAEMADEALARGEYWGWMHGMPHAVKDLANAKGFPTSRGSPLYAGRVAEQDSFMIGRIRAQGAIFIGKTNVPEFGMGSQSYNPVFGATGSAYDPALTAGGSSGGAACGLGTRMLPVADGSDLMGSLRNPGSFNNVIGYRPSQGRVPSGGGGDLFYQQMSTSGPLGRNTEDTIRLLHSVAGHEPSYPLSLRDDLPAF